MSNWDKDRFLRLRESAAANFEFWRGTYQDQSRNRLAMTTVGTPGWTMVNGMPALSQCTNSVGANSGVVDQIVDVTGTFSVECVVTSTTYGLSPILRQVAVGGGGFQFYGDWAAPGVGYYAVILYTNAGAVARTLYLLPARADLKANQYTHVAMTCYNGGASAMCWVKGIPIVCTLIGAGVAANSGAALVRVLAAGGGATGNETGVLIRAYPFALTNSDAQALYGAARTLTGGEV